MALNTTAIVTAIAGLTVSGVRMLNSSAVPEALDPRDAPALFPSKYGFIDGVEVEVDSFGSTAAKKTVTYTLVYIFAHSAVGSERGLSDVLPDLIAKACSILDVFIGNDALAGQAIDITPTLTAFGTVFDPSDNEFHGCEVHVAVTEFIN